MFNGPEVWIVLAVVLLLFGGSQLPKLARNIGKAQKEFKDGLAEGREADEATTTNTSTTNTPTTNTSPTGPTEPPS
jgi:sec-independent protein translocase protein TatA